MEKPERPAARSLAQHSAAPQTPGSPRPVFYKMQVQADPGAAAAQPRGVHASIKYILRPCMGQGRQKSFGCHGAGGAICQSSRTPGIPGGAICQSSRTPGIPGGAAQRTTIATLRWSRRTRAGPAAASGGACNPPCSQSQLSRQVQQLQIKRAAPATPTPGHRPQRGQRRAGNFAVRQTVAVLGEAYVHSRCWWAKKSKDMTARRLPGMARACGSEAASASRRALLSTVAAGVPAQHTSCCPCAGWQRAGVRGTQRPPGNPSPASMGVAAQCGRPPCGRAGPEGGGHRIHGTGAGTEAQCLWENPAMRRAVVGERALQRCHFQGRSVVYTRAKNSAGWRELQVRRGPRSVPKTGSLAEVCERALHS